MGKQIINAHQMQKINRLKVLNYIRRNPDTARPLIADETGLSLSSITNITSYLLNKGFLAERGLEQTERVGRKSTLLRFHTEAYGLIIAILKENNAHIFYTNLEGRVLTQKQKDITGLSPKEVLILIKKTILTLLKQHGQMKTLSIGLIFSGLVLENSRFILSSSLKWKDLDIESILKENTNLPVFVENTSRLKAVWYSNFHSKEDTENMLFLDLENGIGAVQLCHGIINRYVLGEIGHTTIEKDGEPCFCGNNGCLEAMCSKERLMKLYHQHSGKNAKDLSYLAQLYNQEDASAIYAISNCAQYLGMGLANLITLFHPSSLVINAGIYAECPMLLQEAIKHCNQRTYSTLIENLNIIEISVSSENILCGAVFEICDRLFDISYPYNPVE